MRSRRLKAGLELTEVGLGAAQFGNLNRETSQDASTAAVDAAWAAGIGYFDAESGTGRHSVDIPEALWTDLAEAGLVR